MLYDLIKPAIMRTDPETAHNMTLRAMKAGLVPRCGGGVSDPALETRLWHLRFPNPVGLSAGFDKNAEVIGASFGMGFGFAEVGTVTPKPQHGNPKPRVFRAPAQQAVINRLGFPNGGMNAFKANIERYLRTRKNNSSGIIGINIGMNKNQKEPVKDYAVLINMLGPMADYLAVNISSPNTPGLRDLQKREFLIDFLGTLKEERTKACGKDMAPPLLVKFAPDLTDEQQEELAQTVLDAKIDGIILSNTTLDRPDILPEKFRGEMGGLSGQPLTEKSTEVVRNFYKLTKGKIPIIGVGGISSAQQAYDKIKEGASLVQLYSGLIFKGPALPGAINRGLLDLLKTDGYSHISEAVGSDHKAFK